MELSKADSRISLCLPHTVCRADGGFRKATAKCLVLAHHEGCLCQPFGLTEAKTRVRALQISGMIWPAGGPSSYQDWSISSISSSPAPAKWPMTPVIVSGEPPVRHCLRDCALLWSCTIIRMPEMLACELGCSCITSSVSQVGCNAKCYKSSFMLVSTNWPLMPVIISEATSCGGLAAEELSRARLSCQVTCQHVRCAGCAQALLLSQQLRKAHSRALHQMGLGSGVSAWWSSVAVFFLAVSLWAR